MSSFLERIIARIGGTSDNPGAPVVTTRALDTTFTPSTTAYTLCLYTIQLQCTATQTSQVELRSDTASPPTVARASAALTIAATGISTTVRQQLVYVAAPNDTVRLVSSGTGTAPTIVQQIEIPIS